jgi:hypothetical protein
MTAEMFTARICTAEFSIFPYTLCEDSFARDDILSGLKQYLDDTYSRCFSWTQWY